LIDKKGRETREEKRMGKLQRETNERWRWDKKEKKGKGNPDQPEHRKHTRQTRYATLIS
jgi:hypothetical protein